MVKISKEHREANLALWNHWASLHPHSQFYDAEEFLRNPMTLHSIECDLLPDLKGKKVLHMQCHFGQDTLSLQTLGAKEIWGLDFSPVAIEQAEKLASECGITAHWVCADACEIQPELVGEFDIVFASYGVLGWHPDVRP